MATKKTVTDDVDKTSIKVSKETARRLARLAAHRSKSTMALAEEVLSAYADEETPKMIAEIQKEQ